MQWDSYSINGDVIQKLPTTLANDREWNGTMYSTEKAQQLMNVFEDMKPCILKCMLNRFGNVMEMAANYVYLYNECCSIICKNMIKHPTYPPSMFSSAVHVYITHQGLFSDPRWRVISAVFEYTSMEFSAKLKERDAQKSREDYMKKAAQAAPESNSVRQWWSQLAGDKHPHVVLQETHAQVHASEEKLKMILAMLEKVLDSVNSESSRPKFQYATKTSDDQ